MRKASRGSNRRGILLAFWGLSDSPSQPVEMRRSLAAKRGKGNANHAELKNRKLALVAGGRGAREELGMPVAGARARLKNRGGGFDLDQHHLGSRHRDGRGRVH